MTTYAQPSAYLEQIYGALPRVLSCIDANPISTTYGVADRYFWAWKGIDFANGTFQGLANGLAQLVTANLLDDTIDNRHILTRIGLLIDGVRRITRSNGSLDEIFPYESSFCVTALVAHDCLAAIDLIGDQLEPGQRRGHLETIAPLITYLQKADEDHGIISNHLAVAVAALARWAKLHGQPLPDRAHMLLHRLLAQQSKEGWFREYSGADPGYETLCLTYLADLQMNSPELNLDEPIRRSVGFLKYFAHPDGSYGGLYGSRSTRVYYPGGIEALSERFPDAAALATFMVQSVSSQRTVTLTAIDAPNLAPLFNSYCMAARHFKMRQASALPCHSSTPFRQGFPEAGLVADRGEQTYSIVSWKKGGICYHFRGDELLLLDAGAMARDSSGHMYTAQTFGDGTLVQDRDNCLVIDAPFRRYRIRTPSPLDFLILRLLSLTLMRIGVLRRWIKQRLVSRFVLNRSRTRAMNRRTIRIGEKLDIQDEFVGPAPLDRVAVSAPFYATHMASQGYWQHADIQDKESGLPS